jgi:hypothetical protein
MSALPREAREGLMRVWLQLLREQYPGVTWLPVERESEHNAVTDGGAQGVAHLDRADMQLAEAA